MEQRTEEQNYDPIKAEHYQDSLMRSREKMQRELDQRAVEHQEKVERVRKVIQWVQRVRKGRDAATWCALIGVLFELAEERGGER